MKTQTRPRRLRRPARSFVDCLREFLTPAVWKQAHGQRQSKRRSPRWSTQPLVLMLLLMTWCCGDSQPERFETARAFCVVCLPKRRRPGQTVQGFQIALAKLPMSVLRGIAVSVRHVLASRLGTRWFDDGFIGIGCDGSRIECPRTAQLEQRLGEAGKKGSAPTIWVTALVHLRLGLLWAWRLGKGTASERTHLLQLLPWLPAAALLVADAGYFGFHVVQHLVEKKVCFLLRMSSNVTLYTTESTVLENYQEGLVYYFPGKKQKKHKEDKPLRLRLIRIRARKKKNDVWLLTNVLDPRRLSAVSAGKFYRWRWENEGQFRAFKRTLAKVKMVSRSVQLVHREAEGALLALQLMLAQGVLAMRPVARGEHEAVCSPRKVLLAIRQEMYGLVRRGQARYPKRLQQAQRERRERTSAKAIRPWPRRKPHKPPKPPRLLKLTAEQKALISRLETQAA
jgi:Transposase DDE domain